jgi:hypothetical protein
MIQYEAVTTLYIDGIIIATSQTQEDNMLDINAFSPGPKDGVPASIKVRTELLQKKVI